MSKRQPDLSKEINYLPKLTNDLLWFHPLAVSSRMHLMKHSILSL